MKLFIPVALTFLNVVCAFSQQIAFPGAEGFGKYAAGGRGGIVVEVTNLSDAGSGSLRDALTGTSYRNKPRTIVYRVSGTIELQSPINVSNDAYITIAGQTAPGDGICIKNYAINISDCHDIIIRHIRFRPGDKQNCTACDDIDAHSYRNSYHIILDHCSLSWSIDDVLDLTVTTGWSTVQWCLLSEPLVNSKHSKGAHGYIAGWDGNNMAGGNGFGGGSYHHNLLAHGGSRTPRLDSYGGNNRRDLMDFVNNVIYNFGGLGAYGGEAADVNWQNNYYKYGPNTDATMRSQIFLSGDSCRMYLEDNYVDGSTTVTENNSRGINVRYSLYSVDELVQDQPYTVIGINMQSAQDAYKSVLSHVGAVLPRRDACDLRIVDDVINRTGSHIDSQDEVGGWPIFIPKVYDEDYDSDCDGMPNFWEKNIGLDTADASDRNTLAADGYTMLEKYLNAVELSVPVDQITLDKKRNNEIVVSWMDNYFSEEGYILERSVNNGTFEVIAELDKNISSFTDNDVNPNTGYSYRIKVKTSYWGTGYSAIHSTDGLPEPVIYVNPEYEGEFTDDTVTFIWNESANATSYNLYFGVDSNSMEKLTTTTSTKYFTYLNLDEATTFYWRVDALSDSGSVQGAVWSFSQKFTAINETFLSTGFSAYPNPSSDNVTITWNNQSSSIVRVEIFDIEGRKIRELTNKIFPQGSHSLYWDGTTANGMKANAGVFFCRLLIDDTAQVIRINRIK